MVRSVQSDENNPIQIGEISSTFNSPQSGSCKRKGANLTFLPKVSKIDSKPMEDQTFFQSEIDCLFDKLFDLGEKAIRKAKIKDSLASKESLEALTPFIEKTLLEETKKKELRGHLEQDPFFGEYWKDLHGKNERDEFSLQDLKKFRLCLESFSYPLPKTAEEMLLLIKAKLITEISDSIL